MEILHFLRAWYLCFLGGRLETFLITRLRDRREKMWVQPTHSHLSNKQACPFIYFTTRNQPCPLLFSLPVYQTFKKIATCLFFRITLFQYFFFFIFYVVIVTFPPCPLIVQNKTFHPAWILGTFSELSLEGVLEQPWNLGFQRRGQKYVTVQPLGPHCALLVY